jgi:hypothetical protein
MNSKSSISDVSDYQSVCLKAITDDLFFQNFKRDQTYNLILEHSTYQQGQGCIKEIENAFGEDTVEFVQEAALANDSYGGAMRLSYNIQGKEIQVSPSTLRYCKVASDIVSLFGDTSQMNICEIGAGYGGQCVVLDLLFGFKEYHMVDIEEASLLQKKYLNTVGVKNHKQMTPNNLDGLLENYDLIISNYAFSECKRGIQDLYMDKILSKSKHGYMIMNFVWDGIPGFENMMKEKEIRERIPNLKLAQEVPNTHHKNVVYYW